MKPKGTEASFVTTVITVTILSVISILFRRVMVNVLVFAMRVVIFHLIVYIVTRYTYDVVRRDFALSASFVLECFDGSEIKTREGNELVARKENCVLEEIKEVELKSRREKFIHDRTYNSVDLNKVSHFSRRGRASSRLPMTKFKKIFLTENTESESFCVEGFRKSTLLTSKFQCYGKNANGLVLHRYRSKLL